MYLLQLNPITGLVKEDPELDGYLAIESFRVLVQKEGYGIRALTAVALVIDYGSPIKNYNERERPKKAVEIVYNNREAILWNCDEIQLACINYKELQYNPTLEEKKIIDDLRVEKLDEIKEAPDTFEKQKKLRELGSINELSEQFDKKNGTKDLFTESPVRNGYSLSRLERKITDLKSFYYGKQQRSEFGGEPRTEPTT